PIPTSFGRLSSLDYLFLGDNQLSGELPAAIGKLTKLRQLEVFSNPLSGPLPSSLTKLTDLDVFRFDTTTLCVPSSLEAWLRSIATVSSSGLSCSALSMPQLP